jgi:FOG: TPR repeat, SEL1 subfamily
MEKAAKLLTTVLALWLSAATWANGADTFGEPTNYNRAKHVTSAKTAKASAWQAKARADALLGFKYEHGLGVPQSFEVAADLYLRAAEQGDPTGQYFLGLMYDKGPWRLAGRDTCIQMAELSGGPCAGAVSRAICETASGCRFQIDAGSTLHGPRVSNSMGAQAAMVETD